MTARMTYDSKNIDLNITFAGVGPSFKQDRKQNRSASGKIETINMYGIQELGFEALFSTAIYYDLVAWWSWARQGKVFSLVLDSSKIGNTTLDGSAPESDGVTILLVDASAFSANDICLIKTIDSDDEFEIVELDSVNDDSSAGSDTVDAKASLKFTYTTGDIFKHLDYWPSLKALDKDFMPKKTGGLDTSNKYYRHTFKFIEAL